MKIVKFVAISCVLALLSGCAIKSLDPSEKRAIRTIYVDKIETPKSIYYVPPGRSMLGLISDAANIDMEKEFVNVASINHIYIGEMVHDKFISELPKLTYFQITHDAKHADAHLRVKSIHYGYAQSGPFSFKLQPTLSMQIELVRASRVVWSFPSTFDELDSSDSAYQSDILQSPKIMHHLLQQAVDRSVSNIIAKMK